VPKRRTPVLSLIDVVYRAIAYRTEEIAFFVLYCVCASIATAGAVAAIFFTISYGSN
jgi:hypothetical protein